MANVILVTGGSRSGKSSFAQLKAEDIGGTKLFIATCPNIDDETYSRIQQHRAEREGKGWKTIEEEKNIAKSIHSNHHFDTVLIDCLTLWLNNLLYLGNNDNKALTETHVSDVCKGLIHECREHPGTIIFVTNEIGSGIVPDSEYTRLYRDLVGRCNQIMGTAADEVYLVCCGIPLQLKPQKG